MNGLLHQIASGIASGAIYASVALALVMIYQATHHVNFAQGEMATLSTFVALTLIRAGVPFWGAFVLTILLSFALGVAVERILMRPMMNAPVLSSVGVFIGLLLMINALDGWIFGFTIKSFPSPFHAGHPLLGGYVSPHEIGETGSPSSCCCWCGCSSATPRWGSRCGQRRTTRSPRGCAVCG